MMRTVNKYLEDVKGNPTGIRDIEVAPVEPATMYKFSCRRTG